MAKIPNATVLRCDWCRAIALLSITNGPLYENQLLNDGWRMGDDMDSCPACNEEEARLSKEAE